MSLNGFSFLYLTFFSSTFDGCDPVLDVDPEFDVGPAFGGCSDFDVGPVFDGFDSVFGGFGSAFFSSAFGGGPTIDVGGPAFFSSVFGGCPEFDVGLAFDVGSAFDGCSAFFSSGFCGFITGWLVCIRYSLIYSSNLVDIVYLCCVVHWQDVI